MRVNAPRFGEVSLYFRHADVALAVILHSRQPPVAEAKAHALFDFVCFHLYFV